MSPEAEDAYRMMMSLPEDVRHDVVHRLWKQMKRDEALDGDDFDPSVADEWDAEIARRIQEIDEGKVKLIPGEQVFREADELIKRLARNADD